MMNDSPTRSRQWPPSWPALALLVVAGLTLAAEAQPPIGCPPGIPGIVCPTAPTPWGYYPPQWRRWPGSQRPVGPGEEDPLGIEVPDAPQELQLRTPERADDMDAPQLPGGGNADGQDSEGPPAPPPDIQSHYDPHYDSPTDRPGLPLEAMQDGRGPQAPRSPGSFTGPNRVADFRRIGKNSANRASGSTPTAGHAHGQVSGGSGVWEGLLQTGWQPAGRASLPATRMPPAVNGGNPLRGASLPNVRPSAPPAAVPATTALRANPLRG